VSPQLALVLVVVLIAANGLFVAAEFALVAVRRPAIEDAAQEGDRGARRVLRELQHLSFVLSAAQFGITVTSLLVGFLAEGAIGDTLVVPVVEALGLPPESSRGVSIATAFLLSTGLQMVVGELAPKNLAIARPEAVSRATAPAIRVFGALLGPVIRVFDGAAAWMTERVFGVEVADELAGGHTLDELGRIIEASSDEGALCSGWRRPSPSTTSVGPRATPGTRGSRSVTATTSWAPCTSRTCSVPSRAVRATGGPRRCATWRPPA
jgi:CBS domain containing-hemolysin-like protein